MWASIRALVLGPSEVKDDTNHLHYMDSVLCPRDHCGRNRKKFWKDGSLEISLSPQSPWPLRKKEPSGSRTVITGPASLGAARMKPQVGLKATHYARNYRKNQSGTTSQMSQSDESICSIKHKLSSEDLPTIGPSRLGSSFIYLFSIWPDSILHTKPLRTRYPCPLRFILGVCQR